MGGPDIDDETLEKAAREALARPTDAAFWDERLYDTHGLTFGWADRGDDLVEESNYRSALKFIREAAGEDADEHVIDGSVSHWMVGSLRQLFVQVRNNAGEFTPAWRMAVGLALGLQDYPLIDESDFSDLEHGEFERQWIDALGDARNDYENECYDEEREADIPNDELHARVVAILEDRHSTGEFHGDNYKDCDYDAVAKAYAEVIDGARAAIAHERTLSPGQLTLPEGAR